MNAVFATGVPAIRRAGPGRTDPGTRPPCPTGGARRRGPRIPSVMLMIGALIAAMPATAGAWGRLGHRASARLAESRLSPRARAVVRELLEPGESLADAATWADEHSREIRGSAAWHYVNVPISSPHYNPREHARQACVVTKIAEFRVVLADRNAPRARRRQALRFFVHLVQDLHQPMHVADNGDRGGNALQLRSGRYENTNLHQVWDSGLFRSRYREHAEAELVRDLTALADRPGARIGSAAGSRTGPTRACESAGWRTASPARTGPFARATRSAAITSRPTSRWPSSGSRSRASGSRRCSTRSSTEPDRLKSLSIRPARIRPSSGMPAAASTRPVPYPRVGRPPIPAHRRRARSGARRRSSRNWGNHSGALLAQT